MANLALLDLVAPYLVRGENLGVNHAALSAIRVVSYEMASDDLGIAIRGQCQFNGRANLDIPAGRFDIQVAEGTPAFDPSRRDPVFDIRETTLDFELFVPRAGSAVIATGEASITAPGFGPARNVLANWPLAATPSDYPSSGFTLDLILNAPSVRPPFFQPAKMTEEGLLVPDPSFVEVEIHLPRLRFRFAHDNTANPRLAFDLVSAGVSGLDDPGDIGVAELISMKPPYAFIGGAGDRTIGFGFRSATLDLSNDSTPPAVVEKFGFGEDWGGLYLPEVRIFLAPEGVRDLAFEAGVKDLLIGFGDSSGVSGDFEAALIQQGSGALAVGTRFFDENGQSYGIERINATTARARVPAVTRMVVDVEGGRAPYSRSVAVGGGAPQSGAAFQIDLSTTSPQTIVITVNDSTAGTPLSATLTITAERRVPQQTLPAPGNQPAPPLPATLTAPDPSPQIVIASQTDREVVLSTQPVDPAIRWTLGSDPETSPQPGFAVLVGPGETVTVIARKPGSTVPSSVDFFFYFDEPPQEQSQAAEETDMLQFAKGADNVSTVRARSKQRGDRRDGNGQNPFDAYQSYFDLAPPQSGINVTGEASYEGYDGKRDYNYLLARRRAIAVRALLRERWSVKNFSFTIDPEPRNPASYPNLAAWTGNWKTHVAPNDRDFWKARVSLPPGLSTADETATGTVERPATPNPPVIREVDPPAPTPPRPPDWFRSIRLKVRIVRNTLVAGQLDGEFDFQTATQDRLASTGQLGGASAPQGRTLQNGAPLTPDNPADGITRFRLLAQKDEAIGRVTTLIQVGADPADKDGLACFGWLPGETMPADKDFPLTLLGSYLSFWPLLVEAGEGNKGEIGDAALTAAAIAIPGVIAALPWFRVERVILFGGEYLQRLRGGEFEGFLLFDVGIDWSADIEIGGVELLEIEREHPLSVRYKAIGLRFGNNFDGSDKFALRPVFDASRGYTIDVAKAGSLRVAPPFDQILRVLAARISRTNPLTFEVDIALGVDLGVVTIDRARVRVHLAEPGSVELTALAAHVDIPGALAGEGYLNIGAKPDGTSTIGGQIDLTLRPVNLRVAAALEIAQIPPENGGPATGLYVSLDVTLPVGLPLGASGLGIFGFRGIFGMHYERNPAIGMGAGVPALAWLEAAGGKPHTLVNNGIDLWVPHIDRWAFGLGMLIGTMEGGVILNLDGTLLLELPGPRVLILLNARILMPPPSVDEVGMSGGILAVIEISPEHFLIGILIQWEIEKLLTIRIPIEAVFPFAPDTDKWHIYLGKRPDLGPPIEVDVLGIVKGTGYLMFKGDDLPAYKTLPPIQGFAIGLGAAAAFVWGSESAGLYLRVGGGMDAVIGFDPFLLGGLFEITGELRLFIVSIGAEARLTVIVSEKNGDLQAYLHGEACGHVDFFFFEIEGCVDITIQSDPGKPPLPALVEKVSIKSRSPALLVGTGVDRPVDGSLGDAFAGASPPGAGVIVVPIDSIPVVAMKFPPVAASGLSLLGTSIPSAPGVPADGLVERGAEKYRYTVSAIALERVAPAGPAVEGSVAPAVWWTLQDCTETNALAQLALLTWEPTPASKAIEKSEQLKESVEQRWGRVCTDAAPAAPVLWTFRWEPVGPSAIGWDLDGVAWPDPPQTRRSGAPDTELHVSERWRSGNAQLDGMRGIFPAFVIPGLAPCYQGKDDRGPLFPILDIVLTRLDREIRSRLAVGGRGTVALEKRPSLGSAVAATDPVHAALIRRADQMPFRISERLYQKIAAGLAEPLQPLDPAALQRRLALSQPIRRTDLAQALGPAADFAGPQSGGAGTAAGILTNVIGSLVAPPKKLCEVRLLESPVFDDGRAVVFGDPAKVEAVAELLEKAGISRGPLEDVVVLHTGGFAELTLLLFVLESVLSTQSLFLRSLDATGVELMHVPVTLPSSPIPARWQDPAGPWADDIAELLGWRRERGWLPVIVQVPEALHADRVEIGVLPGRRPGAPTEPRGLLVPLYYVGAIECTRASELVRKEWDETQISQERKVISDMLGPASSDNALLFPGSLYKLSVTWSGTRPSDGKADSDTQSFWFRTDAEPPQRLDPWVMISLPADGETGFFGEEPVRIVFNTHDIGRLYAAYGKELRVRFQAASSHHPQPQPGIPHPFAVDAVTLKPVKAAVLSPWEEAVAEVLTGSCIPVDEERIRHSEVKIPIPLDPYTDYILDVEMVTAGAGGEARGPSVYRRHFTTGAFATLEGFAASLRGVKESARAVAPGAMAAVRSFFAAKGRDPIGAELDEQLRSAGLEAMSVPERPRVVVLWEQAGSAPPQPSAVLVDATEPLWRSRPYPAKRIDDSGPATAERWVLQDTEWLRLETGAGAPGVVPPGGILRAPGLQRALIVLAPNSRGKILKLDLVTPAFSESYLDLPERRATVVDLRLSRAPWEE